MPVSRPAGSRGGVVRLAGIGGSDDVIAGRYTLETRDRARRDGRGVAGPRRGPGAPGRAQARRLRARAAATSISTAPSGRRDSPPGSTIRTSSRSTTSCTRATSAGWSWSTSTGSTLAELVRRDGAAHPRPGGTAAAPGGRRAGRRPRRGDRAPRREAVEHPGRSRRAGEALRLRHRPRPGRRLAHPDRAGDRLAGVPRSRGRLGAAGDRCQRRVVAGRHDVPRAVGAPAVRRRRATCSARSTGSCTRSRPGSARRAGWLAPVLLATMAQRPEDRWSMAHVRDFLAAGPSAPLPAPLPRAVPVGVPAGAADPTSTQVITAAVPPAAAAPAPAARDAAPAAGAACCCRSWCWRWSPSSSPSSPGASARTTSPMPRRDRHDVRRARRAPSLVSPPPTADAVTADGMENFIEDYLATVTSDPKAAWDQLTPQFQAESGGFGQYQKFWSGFQTRRRHQRPGRPGGDDRSPTPSSTSARTAARSPTT